MGERREECVAADDAPTEARSAREEVIEESAHYSAEISEILRFKDRINSLTTSVFVLPTCLQ
jgi:hypothetical protein